MIYAFCRVISMIAMITRAHQSNVYVFFTPFSPIFFSLFSQRNSYCYLNANRFCDNHCSSRRQNLIYEVRLCRPTLLVDRIGSSSNREVRLLDIITKVSCKFIALKLSIEFNRSRSVTRSKNEQRTHEHIGTLGRGGKNTS